MHGKALWSLKYLEILADLSVFSALLRTSGLCCAFCKNAFVDRQTDGWDVCAVPQWMKGFYPHSVSNSSNIRNRYKVSLKFAAKELWVIRTEPRTSPFNDVFEILLMY
jgi:hypothetical protein